MRHEIEWIAEWAAPAVMVWDDTAGTLEFTRPPQDDVSGLVDEMVRAVDRAREEGPLSLRWPPAPFSFELKDAAHDPADFLRLIELNGALDQAVRLPPSLEDIVRTPPTYLDDYDPHVVY